MDRGMEERETAWSVALLSTLSAAVDLVRTIGERRQGRDPSEQQSTDVVLPALRDELSSLERHLMALRSSLVASERESISRAALVRRMNDLLLLARIRRDLHGIHQRLMSLYPAVDEVIVEQARSLEQVCSELSDDERLTADRLVAFIDETSVFVFTARDALPES